MKRMVEMEDSLDERAQMAIDEVKDLLLEYLEDNPDTDELPCLHNDLDYSGAVHGIVDGCVPVYTYEIESNWYLHSNELEEAYENAGVGDNPRENSGMAAIYFYIHEQVCNWYHDEAEDIFEEWLEESEDED
jgi:hypothetical protein